jgi:hypothetical protein
MHGSVFAGATLQIAGFPEFNRLSSRRFSVTEEISGRHASLSGSRMFRQAKPWHWWAVPEEWREIRDIQ